MPDQSAPAPVIQLLLTGDEVMSGDTVDSNSALIARHLAPLGLAVRRKVTVGDDADLLCAEIKSMSAAADVLIINGGLGPTVDDRTAQALAAAAQAPLEEHPEARAHLEEWCAQRGIALNAANLKQAMLPASSRVLHNPVGSAAGFQLEVGKCLALCTPGVPGELKAMLNAVLAALKERLGDFPERNVLRLQTFGIGESMAQQMIKDAALDWPAEVELGFRAGAPQLEIKLTASGSGMRAAQERCREDLERLFGDHIIGEGDATLAARVLELLQAEGAALATAESCTGGLIASMLTRVPGASAAFHAGYVTYADAVKQSALGVAADTLARHGAVSEAVVREMAAGALERTEAQYAIAVSGIAGPDGGGADKPPGTVWLAWGRAGDLRTRRLRWPVERVLFQTMVAAASLDLIRRMLLGIETEPKYFTTRRG